MVVKLPDMITTSDEVIPIPPQSLKMKSSEFIFLSACSMVLTALGIDVMLPALGELRTYFNLGQDSTTASQVITFFFMGQIGQIIFGILSDRFGRLPILRIGFPLYITGGVIAAFAPNVTWILASRFVAGVGASGIFTTTIAGVRDRFAGDKMAGTMSLILTIFLFTPILAPFLGAALLSISNWRVVFLAPPVFAIIVFVWSFRLEESLNKSSRLKLTSMELVKLARNILGNRAFVRYTGITTMLFIAFSSYIASSERIISEIYDRPRLFIWIFAGTGALMACCTLLNSKLSSRFGARRTLRRLLFIYVFVAGILFAFTLIFGDPPNMVFLFCCIALLTGINVAIEPNSSALALEPMGAMAGMASAIYGTTFFFIGAGLGSIISQNLVEGVFPLVSGFFVIGLLALVVERFKNTIKIRDK